MLGASRISRDQVTKFNKDSAILQSASAANPNRRHSCLWRMLGVLFKAWFCLNLVFLNISTTIRLVSSVTQTDIFRLFSSFWSLTLPLTGNYLFLKRRKIADTTGALAKLIASSGSEVTRSYAWFGVLVLACAFFILLDLAYYVYSFAWMGPVYLKHFSRSSELGKLFPENVVLAVIWKTLKFVCEKVSAIVWPLLYTKLSLHVNSFVLRLNTKIEREILCPSTLRDQLLKETRHSIVRFRKLTERFNTLLGLLVLVWFGQALFNCYHGVIYFNIRRVDNPLGFLPNVYKGIVHFEPMFLVLALTLMSSRIPSGLEETVNLLNQLCEGSSKSQFLIEVLHLKSMIKEPQIGLALGSWCVISKQFFGSFLGLTVTYCLVCYQLT